MPQTSFPPGARCRVLYDFAAVEEGELSVRAADSVQVAAHAATDDGPSDGWIFVELPGTGRSGYVPADYLAPLVEEATPAHARPSAQTYASPSSVYPGASYGYGAPSSPESAYGHTHTHTHGEDSGRGDPRGAAGVAAAAVLDAVASAVSPMHAPAPPLATPADYAALFASHEEWFKAASAKRADTYRSLQAEAMDIIRAVAEAESRSNALLSRISELDTLIGEERNRWAAKVAEDAAPIAGR